MKKNTTTKKSPKKALTKGQKTEIHRMAANQRLTVGLARISHRICRASHGGGGRRQITNRIGDGEVPDGENSLCGDHIAADLVGILSLLGQTS